MSVSTAEVSFEQVYFDLFQSSPPSSIRYGESASDILREGRGFIDGFDFTLQTQVGCPGGCLFCYVPSGTRLTPAALRGENWGFEVREKKDVAQRLSHWLKEERLADKTIYWSGVTDPYATRSSLTRQMWDVLLETPPELRPRRIAVQTRYRPDRDVTRMAEYNRTSQPSDGGPAVVISYSIGTDRDDLIHAWERATPSFGQRLTTIERLRQAGIWVVPTLSPFGLWNDLEGAAQQFKRWDIPYITLLFFKKNTESSNTPTGFLAYLEREYPQLLESSWQAEQLHHLRRIYGRSHVLIGKAGFASLTEPHQVI